MNYIAYKIIVGDDVGAANFLSLIDSWNSIKRLDDQYMGPEHYWDFYQLGDFDFVEMAIIKWEVWSCWRLKGKNDDFNKGAFVGITCGLFLYNPNSPESMEQLKTTMKFYAEKRKSPLSPMIVLAVNDQPGGGVSEEQRIYIETSGAELVKIDKTDLIAFRQARLDEIFALFLEKLNPDLCKRLNIKRNFWHLPIDELRAILMAERKGIKIRPRHAPPLPPPVAAAPVENIAEAEASSAIPQLTVADISEEELKYYAIGPKGEAVKIEPTITQEEIVELVKKGFKLPPWVVIPRHCPKCFNQNQRSIREVIDKTIILMQNPTIYGMKLVCGNCGKEWHPGEGFET